MYDYQGAVICRTTPAIGIYLKKNINKIMNLQASSKQVAKLCWRLRATVAPASPGPASDVERRRA